MTAPFVPVCRVDEVADGTMTGRVVCGLRVLVVKASGQVTVFADRCPHKGLPLSDGSLDPVSGAVTCRAHGWRFDGATGAGIDPEIARLDRLPSREEEGEVRVLPPAFGRRLPPWNDGSCGP